MGSENSKTIRESLGLIPPEIAENSLHKTVEGENLTVTLPLEIRENSFYKGGSVPSIPI